MKIFIAYFYYLFNEYVTRNSYRSDMGKWFYLSGDVRYLANHDLNSESIVFDVGGYVGVFTDKLVHKYDSRIYVFEPVKKYLQVLKRKYKDNKNVQVFDFGLSNKTETAEINVKGDKSSRFVESAQVEKVKLVDISEFMLENKIEEVDLITINIEGGEYDLLERMLEKDLVKNFKFIQVQFHNFVESAENRHEIIISKLRETHKPTFKFPFIWEGFKRM